MLLTDVMFAGMIMTAVMLLSPASPRVAVNALRRLADRWQLTGADVAKLLCLHERTVRRMYEEPSRASLPADVKERVANLIVIWEDLAALFGPGEVADGWVRRPNADFGDEPPLRRMTTGLMEDLIDVRRYLDLARQGW